MNAPDLFSHTPPEWARATPPSRSAALARVARIRPAEYARTRNHLEGAVTGLSPYLTHGVLTLPEVLAAVLQRGPLPADHKLVFEFGWREYFRHVWAHRRDGILASFHAGPQPGAAYASALPADIRQAQTGVPAIDEAVRTLYTTGSLHNHARMWLASYVVHVRHVHWRAGADWMVAHLLDGDLASNHLSWQWVAGTGSHKPYLFNAENVARFAPAAWHSAGSVIDRSYEALEHLAHGRAAAPKSFAPSLAAAINEPTLHATPPADLHTNGPQADSAQRLQGRDVWLVHPWALRAAPPDLPSDCAVIGVYPSPHHAAWPWPQARWRWVDAAMQTLAAERWYTDSATLAHALQGARSVQAFADPHIDDWLPPAVQRLPSPTLFAPVDVFCRSFTQWWTRATRGLKTASELL